MKEDEDGMCLRPGADPEEKIIRKKFLVRLCETLETFWEVEAESEEGAFYKATRLRASGEDPVREYWNEKRTIEIVDVREY